MYSTKSNSNIATDLGDSDGQCMFPDRTKFTTGGDGDDGGGYRRVGQEYRGNLCTVLSIFL